MPKDVLGRPIITSRTPESYPGKAPEFDEWSRKEQSDLETIHSDYLARLAADKEIKAKYAAITEEYKEKHLAHIKLYDSTASSRRSTL